MSSPAPGSDLLEALASRRERAFPRGRRRPYLRGGPRGHRLAARRLRAGPAHGRHLRRGRDPAGGRAPRCARMPCATARWSGRPTASACSRTIGWPRTWTSPSCPDERDAACGSRACEPPAGRGPCGRALGAGRRAGRCCRTRWPGHSLGHARRWPGPPDGRRPRGRPTRARLASSRSRSSARVGAVPASRARRRSRAGASRRAACSTTCRTLTRVRDVGALLDRVAENCARLAGYDVAVLDGAHGGRAERRHLQPACPRSARPSSTARARSTSRARPPSARASARSPSRGTGIAYVPHDVPLSRSRAFTPARTAPPRARWHPEDRLFVRAHDRRRGATSACSRSTSPSTAARRRRRRWAPCASPSASSTSPARWSRRACSQAQVERTQRLEAVGSLVAGVAHDFNNMLGAHPGLRLAAAHAAARRQRAAGHGALARGGLRARGRRHAAPARPDPVGAGRAAAHRSRPAGGRRRAHGARHLRSALRRWRPTWAPGCRTCSATAGMLAPRAPQPLPQRARRHARGRAHHAARARRGTARGPARPAGSRSRTRGRASPPRRVSASSSPSSPRSPPARAPAWASSAPGARRGPTAGAWSASSGPARARSSSCACRAPQRAERCGRRPPAHAARGARAGGRGRACDAGGRCGAASRCWAMPSRSWATDRTPSTCSSAVPASSTSWSWTSCCRVATGAEVYRAIRACAATCPWCSPAATSRRRCSTTSCAWAWRPCCPSPGRCPSCTTSCSGRWRRARRARRGRASRT